jgi:predicted TIM-barrel fold metal-dependent hydrolase
MVSTEPLSRSARLRQGLAHPIVDSDAHYIELAPAYTQFVRDKGASRLLDGVEVFDPQRAWWHNDGKPEDWVAHHQPASLRGFSPGDTRYFATVTTARRYHDRLGEAGIDYAILYPTLGLGLHDAPDDRRLELCKLANEFLAEQYLPYADRLTPAAVVPMDSPDEAIEALCHAADLGLKVAAIPSFVTRPIEAHVKAPADVARRLKRIDAYGIDSPYDYDPFWAKAVELGFPIASHSTTMGFTDRCSPTTALYNQLGNFAAGGEVLAKALFLGGVTQRFPKLRVALLEGGVAHGARLYGDLCSRWQVRRPETLRRRDPSNLDSGLLHELYAEEGGRWEAIDTAALIARIAPPASEWPNDFRHVTIESLEDIRATFCTSFAWGCEAEDPLVGLAFASALLPLGARLPVLFGSDLGHWDVPDFTQPLAEAFELMEEGVLDEAQFRDFTFANAIRFHGAANPNFFAGTVVEKEAADLLAGGES